MRLVLDPRPRHGALATRYTCALAASLVAAGLASTSAMAGSLIFDDSVSPCTGVNCSSVRLPGTVGNSSPNSPSENTDPFVLQVFAGVGECLRLDVLSEDRDLETVVASPDGTVWRNDDRPGDLRPLVAVRGAPTRGWYTVQISRFAGQSDYSNFVLAYGRYAGASNPNCNNPTLPLALARGAPRDSSK